MKDIAHTGDGESPDDIPPAVVAAEPPQPLPAQIAADIIALADEFSPWSFTEHDTTGGEG